MVFDVSLEMQSDSKNYVSVQDDEITELVHTTKQYKIGMRLTLSWGHNRGNLYFIQLPRELHH